VKRWALAVVLTSLLAAGACSGSDDNATDESRPGAAALGNSGSVASADLPDPHYAVFPSGVPGTGWELAEAIRQLGGGRDVLGGLPGVDWYAEFEGPELDGNTDAHLSLTGYAQSLEERQAESVSSTARVTEGEINGRKAFWSVEPEDPESGATVTWEVTPDYTLELFGTGIGLDELLAMARTVKDATEAEWVAAGGVLSDCAPGEGCPDSAEG
jgi:hypothetical protein